MADQPLTPKVRGRGAQSQPANRYLTTQMEWDLTDCDQDAELLEGLRKPDTVYHSDESQTIVSQNNSPDIPFRYSMNPYRGCAHGCSYCYARPTHEYLGLSAGLDFETQVFVKHRAAELLRKWLAKPKWQGEWIALSGVTDCYQPAEQRFKITRSCLAVAAECRQPMGIITKNALVVRDLDLLTELAQFNAVHVAISLTTLDSQLARTMEPRTSTPEARLRTLATLSAAGIPTQVVVAPIIPGLTDSEVPAILAAAREAGARAASFVLLRLPKAVDQVFFDWLRQCYPDRATKVEMLTRATRDGQLYKSEFGKRMRGEGEIARQIEQTFRVFAGKYGFEKRLPPLDSSHFRPPGEPGGQRRLFD
ncbi:PA0069 family radical SAM protein [Aeoliella mucimassa]|uniref:Radical SAM superfamily protein n=1 Tax=Aeoliella mucimassa TaxID=2527972 RepID=A0A518AU74_9BACT|nr:PA0069 family radical SAM protein [Aeoliella mucimassa]QDU58284.1 Radical SAM superfamily protein [Aeoliella mucimassa]